MKAVRSILILLALLLPGCEQGPAERPEGAVVQNTKDSAEALYAQQRRTMVRRDLQGRDISSQRVLAAMGKVPRHEFVPEGARSMAYEDHPLSIGHGQTISQPYIVALMTQLAEPKKGGKALDIGTGSGYQAAVLAELTGQVYGIEIICPLADFAAANLQRTGYGNVTVKCGDGYQGWPQHGPFDTIIVGAAPDHVPGALVEQLAPGGRLVLPVGDRYQTLKVFEKRDDGTVREWDSVPVRFVPMTGEAQQKD